MSKNTRVELLNFLGVYAEIRHAVVDAGYGDEILWQAEVEIADITSQRFLGEFAWVVLCAGISERVVRSRFPHVSHAFHGWKDLEAIMSQRKSCRQAALDAFRNVRKIDAILSAIKKIADEGFSHTKLKLIAGDINYLSNFPYMGPATSRHLAKNLGIDASKPDRHLIRIAKAAGFSSSDAMCETISVNLRERVSVIDVVLWRYATLDRNYLTRFNRVA